MTAPAPRAVRPPEGVTVALVRDMLAIDALALPRSTVAKAELCLLDYLSCAFAARRYPQVAATIATAAAWPAAAGCPVIASEVRVPPAEAAFVNSVMAAAAQRTDMHPAITSHCAPVVFPVALAVASQQPVTGAEFIAAVVAGYEAMARVGRVMIDDRFRRHFRATSVLGSIGAAITAARLLRQPLDVALNTLALSVNTASGLMEFGHSGEIDLFFQPANAARNGITAAVLAGEGVQASRTILEGPAGLLAAFGARERATDIASMPRARFEIEAVDFKRVPACVFVQAALHAAERIVLRERLVPHDVESVELRTFEAAVRYPGCDDPGPIDTLLAARMSLQYAVASVLTRGEVAEANFTDFQDPAIRMLVPKVRLTTADEFTAPYPARQGAHVTVRTTDGRVLEGRVDEVPSFDRDGIVARYRRVGADVLPQAQVQELERMSLGCAALADVRALIALLPAATAAAPRVRSATLQ